MRYGWGRVGREGHTNTAALRGASINDLNSKPGLQVARSARTRLIALVKKRMNCRPAVRSSCTVRVYRIFGEQVGKSIRLTMVEEVAKISIQLLQRELDCDDALAC